MSVHIDGRRQLRWGIIGTGGIADAVARDIDLSHGCTVHGVAAREPERAREFALSRGIPRHYDSYHDLVDDDELDVVYIATTHPFHRPHALMAIEAGKHVVIEKPLGLNAAQAREVLDAARRRGVFAMEAMWMRLNPLIRHAQELVAQGIVGEVRGLRHEFGLGMPFDAAHRLYDRANGGGALLDLGIYPVTFAYLFLKRPDTVRTVGTMSPTGVDETVQMEWFFGAKPQAQLWCSISVDAPNQAAILGTDGWISFDAPAYRPSGLTVRSRGDIWTVPDPLAGAGSGYGPQIEEVERCIRAGLMESPLVPHDETIAILEILDEARAALGVVYPDEAPSEGAR